MPNPHQIHHTPPNGLGHARPVPPHAALKRPVRVEQEKWQHVDVPGLCDGVLPPRLEHVARQRAPERLPCRRVLVRRHGRHDGHLIVQVCREVRRKRVHDPAEGPGVIRRRVGGVEECLEGSEPRQEGFYEKKRNQRQHGMCPACNNKTWASLASSEYRAPASCCPRSRRP